MELKLNREDLKQLEAEGLLAEMIRKCTFGEPGPEPETTSPPEKKVKKKKSAPAKKAAAAKEEDKPQYTVNDLANMATALMDQGKQETLLALLDKHHVASLPELPPEDFAEFALELEQEAKR